MLADKQGCIFADVKDIARSTAVCGAFPSEEKRYVHVRETATLYLSCRATRATLITAMAEAAADAQKSTRRRFRTVSAITSL